MAKGYTRIENDFMRGLVRLDISRAAYKVLLAITCNTLLFHRNQHELSNSFLMKTTGLTEMTVIRAIHDLEEKKYIEIVSESRGTHPRIIRLCTNNIVTLTKMLQGGNKNDTPRGNNSVSGRGNSPVSQEIKKENKESNKREKKDFFLFSNEKPECFASIEEANRWYAEHPEEDDEDED